MASSTADSFSDRPALRTRPPSTANALASAATASPNSPRTPLLNRSVSSQYGSPGSFRVEQEDYLIYELGARHLSAGWAGESRPRCIHLFTPENGRRVGDYRACDPGYRHKRMKLRKDEDWGQEHELYRSDLRSVDLGLAEDKLERAVRMIHIDYLQLDQKSRKAVLVLPSLLPTPIVEMALKVLFNHYAQPPSVVLWTSPMLACVGAGVRNGLVIDIGWEETVVAAIGEYKEVAQRRTTRAGKQLTREMAKLLEDEANNQLPQDISDGGAGGVTFEYAEQVTRRMAWCRSMTSPSTSEEQAISMIKLPSPWPDDLRHIHLPFNRLSRPSETTFVTEDESSSDDHNLSIPKLAYRALLSLPLDLRTLCISRILIVGGPSHIPGLKTRVLQELSSLVNTRGWDVVNNYGSATAHHSKILQERSANIAKSKDATNSSGDVPLSPAKKPIQDSIPHATRIHDDAHDPISRKVDAEMRKGKAEVTKAVVRGVETLGAWAGASLVLSLRVKGVCEVERDEFLKNGLNDEGMLI